MVGRGARDDIDGVVAAAREDLVDGGAQGAGERQEGQLGRVQAVAHGVHQALEARVLQGLGAVAAAVAVAAAHGDERRVGELELRRRGCAAEEARLHLCTEERIHVRVRVGVVVAVGGLVAVGDELEGEAGEIDHVGVGLVPLVERDDVRVVAR